MDNNRYLIKLSESDRTDFGRVAFVVPSREQQVFSAIWSLESDVNNGGFVQFFDNEDPLVVSFTPIAIRAIGAARCADIESRAVALGSSHESEQAAEKLDGLDSEFLECPDNLTELLFSFVCANEATFGEVPEGVH